MVVGPVLGAGASLVSALLSARAQRDATNLQYQNLFEQKRSNRERERLAKADRTDAYGNRVTYSPGGGFETEVTPLTRAILGAQQKEQLAGYRDDAPRYRAALERTDQRAQRAGEVYDEEFNKYRYGREKTEAEYVAEAVREAVAARREGAGPSNPSDALVRGVLRLNSSSEARNAYNASKAYEPEETLSQAIAAAKRKGSERYLAETGARKNLAFGEMNQLRSIADAMTNPTLNWNNENAALSGRADSALQSLIQSNLAGSQAVGNAYGQAAASAARSAPDLSGVASALSRINLNLGGGKNGRVNTGANDVRNSWDDEEYWARRSPYRGDQPGGLF